MEKTVTIQKTSKGLKFQLVLCWAALIAALIWSQCIRSSADMMDERGDYTKPLILGAVAICWYIITKIRIWWNHG